MRVLYLANHGNWKRGSDDTEGHIAHGLENLGCEVVCMPQEQMNISIVNKYDVVLFHHWYSVDLRWLSSLDTLKVCWAFDKAWNGRDLWLESILPHVDVLAVTDGEWAKDKPVMVLRQGIGDRDTSSGTPCPDKWKGEIVFVGSPYGERRDWCRKLQLRYGNKFIVVNNAHNRELYDLFATCPVVVAPPFPGNDHYWSNRIYLTLGAGGFLIHPKYGDLAKEYKDGIHYVGYRSHSELERKIDYFLTHPEEREIIRRKGTEKTLSQFTYTDRCRSLLKAIQRAESTGKKE